MSVLASRKVRLLESVPLSREARHFVFEALDQSSFDFEPGQHICLRRDFDGKPVDRCYSIASAPRGTNRLELCIKSEPEGSPFGAHLSQMRPGDELEYRGPAGKFHLAAQPRDSIFVAVGTGITPLRSMLQYLTATERTQRQDRELTLILGAKDPERLYYRQEFQTLADQHANFRFWPTLSRPPESWTGRSGHAHQHLADALRGRNSEVHVYLCGPKAMVETAREQLSEAGLDDDAVFYEKF